METPLDAALFEFIKRDHKFSNPKGIYTVDGIWLPDETEAFICCRIVTPPFEKFTYKLEDHCRTLTHISNLFKVDKKELQKKIKDSKHTLAYGMFDKLVHIKQDTRQYSAAIFCVQLQSYHDYDNSFIKIWTPIQDSDLDFYKRSTPEYQFYIIQQHPMFETLSKNLKDQGWFFGWFSMSNRNTRKFLMPAMYQHMTPKEGKDYFTKFQDFLQENL